MRSVFLTALGVGGATMVGALLGFLIKKPSHRFNDIILSLAAGVMLASAVTGLLLPSLACSTLTPALTVLVTVSGIFCGALCLNLVDRLVPHLHRLTGTDAESHPEKNEQLNKVLLFVIAIAIHNLPEGIAAGVSFGTGDQLQALTVAGGIALQNIPEGMVIIAPMLASGVKPGRTLIIALLTGVIEVIGTLIGYLAVSISVAILPFSLAFAGGTMLYVVSDEMIPETHAHGFERAATYALLFGFSLMLALDYLIG